MKILKTLYTATLCAAMAVSTSSCLNSWLDQSPADGIDAETAIDVYKRQLFTYPFLHLIF